MDRGSCFVWTVFLLSCVFKASENAHVPLDVSSSSDHKGDTDLDQILSRILINLLEGIDPENLNLTFINARACSGMKEQLELLNRQLQQTTARNRQLDNEAFGLRRDVRLLNLQLATCSSTASAITGSYQTQLLNKMKQLLQISDSETFLILNIYALTREVNTLQKKINHAANLTESSDLTALQRKHQEKMDELKAKMQQLEGSHPNTATLILQIISLQDQIWDLEQAQSRKGENNHQARILALQGELDKKIAELRGKGDAGLASLELISVQSRIAVTQRRINVCIEKYKSLAAEYQRQWKQKIELLKRKILQLGREEDNKELTQEIFKLQSELEQLKLLKINAKKIFETEHKELRVILDQDRTKQANLQRQMEEADFSQAQLIMKIISIMKEVRELGDDEQQQTTSTGQTTTLETLLQEKEKEIAKAQAEIKELQSKLVTKTNECSGLEERYEVVRADLEQKITELNRTGDSAALILNVINLHNDLKTLRDLISSTKDPQRISELQQQLKEKQAELNSKNADIERLFHNPRRILTIIELQNEIWDLQKNAANETTGARIEQLQNRVDFLIRDLDDLDDNTKLLMRIISLQSQVEQLQRLISAFQTLKNAQVAKILNDLDSKKEELQKSVKELNEKSQTNAKLILTVANLQNQLRNLEEERKNDNKTSSLSITQLKQQLKDKMLEHARDQAQISVLKALLQTKDKEHAATQAEVRELQKKNEECFSLEKSHEDLKTELEQKITELNRTRESNAALILNVINLHDDLKTLRDLISSTKDPERISELKRQMKEKQEELNSRTTDIERLVPDPKIILTIIELQNEIWDLQKKAANETTDVEYLQNRVEGLISEIQDTGDDNTKLILKIIALQSQVEWLQKQLSVSQELKDARVTKLTSDLKTRNEELQKNINELNEKNQTSAKLILTITDLHNQLRNITDEKKKEGQTASSAITQLKQQLKAKEEEHSRDQAEIRALQDKLNKTEAECSNNEDKLKDLQNELDAKLKELQSKSESVTSLALQVSTLTLQLEELKRQLENTKSETKIKELQTIIKEKNEELKKKTEELKERSAQPQRLLQIIAVQTQIEKLAYVAANDTDYNKLRALQDHLNYLVEGLQDESDENTKLMFKILAQNDEIARLKQQEKNQVQAALKKIAELENERDNIRNQIDEKTKMLDTSDMTIANLSSQIMELHKKIKPLEEQISDLKETNAENTEELQRRVELAKRQLQDSERLLSDADDKNFNLIMEIADLRAQLKKAQKKASKREVPSKNIDELEQKLKIQQRENRKLENINKDLMQEIKELKVCCTNVDTQCDDIKRQLQQSQEDADRLHQQLLDQAANVEQLQQELDKEALEKSDLQHAFDIAEKELQLSNENADWLQQQLNERNANLTQLQEELEQRTRDNNELQEENNNLKIKKAELEEKLQGLEKDKSDEEEKKISARSVTFDANTANPRVTLSADHTELSITSKIQDVPDHPGRFDTALAALGANGFSSGRNYWEVSVAGKLCYQVGMASETAKRKGPVQIRSANGFWTIVLNRQGQYKAVDRTFVLLPVVTPPLTLGVLLNYKEGEISFYDAGTRTHLYTFVGQTFRDRIHPFVNFCVEDADNQTPIVLRPPGSVDWIK